MENVGRKKKKKFNSEKAAYSFAKKVGGTVNDLTKDELSKSKYSVTYYQTAKTIKNGQTLNYEMCPEENRDFGYSNDFWS